MSSKTSTNATSSVPKSSSPLVVVANRLPFILRRNEETGELERKQSAGGLVTAVAPAVLACDGMWVGWPGMHVEDPTEPIPESSPEDKAPTAGLRSDQVVAVNIDKSFFDSYYNGCCNGTFWPLFHSMPDRAIFSSEHYQAYTHVNELFAEDTMKALKKITSRPGVQAGEKHLPIIWIHDYHLMLAANSIRASCEEEDIKCKLGFFLHIPFPPWDIFRLFPWDDEILQGMLGCDLVGFHIEDYCRNFLDCCARRLGCKVDRRNKLVEFCGRTVRVRTLPIGIPYERFAQMANDAPRVVKADGKSSQIILGVDRLDYTKGIVHRLKALEHLYENHPEHLENVTLLQVAVPSRTDVREYQALKEEIDQEVGRINGRFSTPNWSPIRYLYGCVGQNELAAFYRDSSVALVTPLRDGMNLVAKEYVACQVDKPGVLILSPFAGAGETMHEALVVNPYEISEVAEVIHRALTMPEDERELRMYHLRRRERQMDISHWLNAFLADMGALIAEDGIPAPNAPPATNGSSTQIEPMSVEDFDEFLASYIDESSKLALLLDYDGTLAPIAPKPHLAFLPKETKKVLLRLSNIADVHIAIISGRSLQDVKEMVGIDGLTYAGNHGLEILHPDGTKFVHPVPQGHEENLSQIKQELQESCCRDGAWIEPKGALLTFHYRGAPANCHSKLKTDATKIITKHGFTASPAHCAIEARPPVQWDKGRASIHILRTMYGVDWCERVRVIYCGDDHTDEDAMRALKGIATTFRVTTSHAVRTAATRRLSSTDSVLTLLRWVERHMQGRPMKTSSRRRASFSSWQLHGNGSTSFEMSDPEDWKPNTSSNNNNNNDNHKNDSDESENDADQHHHHQKEDDDDQRPASAKTASFAVATKIPVSSQVHHRW